MYIEIYPWFVSFTISILIFFQVILDNIIFMKIKILKPKYQNLNSKLNGLHFVKFIQNIPLVANGKVPQKGLL